MRYRLSLSGTQRRDEKELSDAPPLAADITSEFSNDLQFDMDLDNQADTVLPNSTSAGDENDNDEELISGDIHGEGVEKISAISPSIFKAAFGDFPSQYNNHFCRKSGFGKHYRPQSSLTSPTESTEILPLVSFSVFEEDADTISPRTAINKNANRTKPTFRSNPSSRSKFLVRPKSRFSSFEHRLGKKICASVTKTRGIGNKSFGLKNLVDDTKIMILTYLSAPDVRSFSSADHTSLSIARSPSLWTEIFSREWPLLRALKRQNPLNHIIYRDFTIIKMAPNMSLFGLDASRAHQTQDRLSISLPLAPTFAPIPSAHPTIQQHNTDFCLNLPSAFFLKNIHCTSGLNFSVLHGLSRLYPTKIDNLFLHSNVASKKMEFRSFIMLVSKKMNVPQINQDKKNGEYVAEANLFESIVQTRVLQFSHEVGVGDRCVRSNNPFPFICKNDILSQSYMQGLFSRGMSMLGMTMIKPFVTPIVSKVDRIKKFDTEKNGPYRVEVDLTPRLVAYFEVSIFQRDKSQEPLIKSENDNLLGQVTRPPDNVDHIFVHESDCVAVGISSEHFCTSNKMPGWDLHSYGYHGDDGGIFHASGEMIRNFGPAFGVGDTIGCGIDYTRQSVFFTLNGHFLGYAFQEIDLTSKFFPTVGIDSNCPFQCNFGESPFVFDLKPFSDKYLHVVKGLLFDNVA
mmetsp:Transcript_4784/g.10103  ORF Transcript_4784/g.10103 Transcript_4784/m.10103 type:complete len:683 (+) Transcript_4784:265-2313(+)